MTLRLPGKSELPSAENIESLRDQLTSVIAGHPNAVECWTFYEVLDAYLGPWEDKGYLIAYGKHYCKAFNANEQLQGNVTTRKWVHATTVALQESLRDFVVSQFREHTLPALTEAELRAFAFSVHSKAYMQAGLTTVALSAPAMIPIVASIPLQELNPFSKNFGPTIKELLTTIRSLISKFPWVV